MSKVKIRKALKNNDPVELKRQLDELRGSFAALYVLECLLEPKNRNTLRSTIDMLKQL